MSLFEDGMVLYIENPKVSTQNLFTLMNEFSMVVTYNINIKKSFEFITLTMNYQKFKVEQ